MLVRSPVDLQATGVVGTSARDIRADFEGPGCDWLQMNIQEICSAPLQDANHCHVLSSHTLP